MKHLTKNKAYQDNYSRLRMIGEKKGYVFNPNQDWVEQVVLLMTNSFEETGKYLCPCKQHFPPDIDKDETCPCPNLDVEISKDGYCHCRLFFKKDFKKERFNILETITCPG